MTVNRERWKANPDAVGDDLAWSLIIDTATQQDSSDRCKLAHEAVSVAQSPEVKKIATDKVAACTPP